MNEQRIEELKNALRDVVELIVNRDQPMTDDLRSMLAQVMEHVANRIQQLRQEEAEPPIPPSEPVRMSRSMPSSNVHSFGYDDKNQKLYVKFQGDYPDQNGPVYSYEGVPQSIFEIFRQGAIPARTKGRNAWGEWWVGKVPSLGASLFTLIKNGPYPYQRLT